MGEYYNARIEIGGPLMRAEIRELLEVAKRVEARTDYASDQDATEDDVVDGEVLVLMSGDAPYGCFMDLEDWLKARNIPFVRYSGGYYESMPIATAIVDGEEFSTLTDDDGIPLVRADAVSSARDALRCGEATRAMEILENSVVTLPNIPPVKIVRSRRNRGCPEKRRGPEAPDES